MGDGQCWVHLDVQVHAETTERQKQMDGRTEQRGLEARGAAERENLIRKEVQGSVRKGKIKDD